MKIKRFYLLSVVFVCFGIVFTGCSKDDNGPGSNTATSINATVYNGSNYSFDNVKAVMYPEKSSNEYVAGSSSYSGGGFNIDLPGTVNNAYLYALVDENSDELSSSWIKVSDNTAIGNSINLEAYKSGNYQGDFYYGAESQNTSLTSFSMSVAEGLYLYVNKDVNITGSATVTDNVDGIDVPTTTSAEVALKKGWNIMYMITSVSIRVNASGNVTSANGTNLLTTQDPGGLKWYYEDDFNNLLSVSSALRSSQSGVSAKFLDDIQKTVSKYRIFPKSK